MLSLLMVVVLTQSAPVDAQNQCTHDDDCLISTMQCCTGCCGPAPYATTREAAKAMTKRCSEVKCAKAAKCAAVDCEPPASPDAFRAKCVEHQCRMVPR